MWEVYNFLKNNQRSCYVDLAEVYNLEVRSTDHELELILPLL